MGCSGGRVAWGEIVALREGIWQTSLFDRPLCAFALDGGGLVGEFQAPIIPFSGGASNCLRGGFTRVWVADERGKTL